MRHLVLYRRYTSGDLLSGGVRWDSSPSPIFGSSGYLIPKCMEEKQIICSFLISKEFFLLAFSAESFPRWGESSLNITSTPRRKLMVTTSETISFFKTKKKIPPFSDLWLDLLIKSDDNLQLKYSERDILLLSPSLLYTHINLRGTKSQRLAVHLAHNHSGYSPEIGM